MHAFHAPYTGGDAYALALYDLGAFEESSGAILDEALAGQDVSGLAYPITRSSVPDRHPVRSSRRLRPLTSS